MIIKNHERNVLANKAMDKTRGAIRNKYHKNCMIVESQLIGRGSTGLSASK
jgi:hypothetical protein